ncbi:GTP cyclohydrolase 1 type [Trichinella pseudospiralis]
MDAKCDCQNPRDLAALQTSFPRISESRMASHLHLIFPPFGSSFGDYTTSYVVRVFTVSLMESAEGFEFHKNLWIVIAHHYELFKPEQHWLRIVSTVSLTVGEHIFIQRWSLSPQDHLNRFFTRYSREVENKHHITVWI